MGVSYLFWDNLFVIFKNQAVHFLDCLILRDDQKVIPKHQYQTPILCFIKTQRRANHIYTKVEVWNCIYEFFLECSASHFKQHVTAESFLDMTFIKYTYWFTSHGKRHIKKTLTAENTVWENNLQRQLLLALQHMHYNNHIHTVPASQLGIMNLPCL